MAELILHNYPQSPVSEKVRVGLGIKRLAWRSVEVPRLPPKPDLMPLTGGYRRTPVLQIGADIFCDSQCILRELQRRHPEPTFYPGGADGMVWGLSQWTDGRFFEQAVKLVLGSAADTLPADFARDRGRLYLGPDADLRKVRDELPHVIAQLRGQFGWIEQRLQTGRRFMLGDAPGLPDALAYYLVWFVRGRWKDGPAFLSQFSALEAWEQRVKALGHGTPSDLDAKAALAIARDSRPETPERADPNDAQGLAPGITVAVAPDVDGGDPSVEGTVHYLDGETIAVRREDPQVGAVCVHFPLVGYRVVRL